MQLFESSFGNDLDQVFFGHLKCVLPDDWQTPPADLTPAEREDYDRELIGKINEELQLRALARTGQAERFTYYMVVETPAALSEQELARRDRVLERIKRRFPNIAVLCTAPRPRFPWRELEPFGNLRALLYKPPRDS